MCNRCLFFPINYTGIEQIYQHLTGGFITFYFIIGLILIAAFFIISAINDLEVLPVIFAVLFILWIITAIATAVHMGDDCTSKAVEIEIFNEKRIVTYSECLDRPHLFGEYTKTPEIIHTLTLSPKVEN